jgi:histidine ammonia-lyase
VGALHDAVAWGRQILSVELNSSNDNPLYDLEAGAVRSGGNFSGFHVALAMDTLKTAVASVADLLDRQFELINDEKYNMGLGMCCTNPLPEDHPEAGTHHGFKGMQLAISALAAEALNACMPMTVFSRSTACHNQDKVSMGAAAARQAREVVDLTQRVAAIHLLILCQAADLRGADRLGEGSRRVYAAVRKVSPFVEFDRELRTDIEQVVDLIRSGALVAAIEADA